MGRREGRGVAAGGEIIMPNALIITTFYSSAI